MMQSYNISNSLLVGTIILVAAYLYTKLRYLRVEQYAHIPQLPNHLL